MGIIRRENPALRLKISISKIAVAPLFDSPWELTWALDYAGTVTCNGSLPSSATPYLIRLSLPPLWDPLPILVLPSAVSPFPLKTLLSWSFPSVQSYYLFEVCRILH